MAKRFTDTEKWYKKWFGGLSKDGKLLWQFLCDNCSPSGVIEFNPKLFNFLLGFRVDKKLLNNTLGSKIIWIEDDVMFIPSFVDFQYGQLSESCKPHLPIILGLKKHGLYDEKNKRVLKEYTKGMQTLEEKDKDKDKDKDKEQDKPLTTISANDNNIAFEEFWAKYPKKTTKRECEDWWRKNPNKRVSAVAGLAWYATCGRVRDGFALDAIRYLKREIWQDNPAEYTSTKKDGVAGTFAGLMQNLEG